MKKLHTTLLASALLVLLAATGARADDAIKLGAVFNLSGSQAAFDAPSLRAAELAVSAANAARGTDQAEVELVVADPAGVVDQAASSTAAMLDENSSIAAVLGLSDTDMVLSAAPVAAARGLVFLTSGATSPKLPGEVPTFLFLACFGDNVQAAAAAEFVHADLGARTAAIVYNESTSYTTLLQGYFHSRFEQLGGEIVDVRSYAATADQAAAIDGLPDADVVFLSSQVPEETAAGVTALRAAGFTGPIIGGDGYDGQAVWATHPELGDVYFTTHVYLGDDNPDPRVIAFAKAYSMAYDGAEPDGFAALAYDAVGLLLAAIDAADIDEAASATPEEFRLALANLTDYRGVTGTISYENGSRIPRKSVTIIEIRDGAYNLVKEVLPAEVPAP